MKAPCIASRRLYPNATICPELYWDGEKHRCHLMEIEGIIGENYRKELYAGQGCCCNLNTWRKEEIINRLPQEKSGVIVLDEKFQKFLLSLGRQFMSGDAIYLTIKDFQKQLMDDGYSENSVKEIGKAVFHLVKQQKSNFMEGFLG